MVEGKEGISKKDVFGLITIFSIAIFIVFLPGFVIAFQSSVLDSTATNVVNYSAAWNGTNVNEDKGHIYNITINNSMGSPFQISNSTNVTSVNITLWGDFTFNWDLFTLTSGSNGTANRTGIAAAAGAVFFNLSTTNGIQTLSWNVSGAAGTPLIANNSTMFFWFNATAPNPGKYNMTVRVIYNQTGTIFYNETNITVFVNDTTAPENVTFSDVYGLNKSMAASALSAGNYSGDLILNISTADNGNAIRSVFFNFSYSNFTKKSGAGSWFFKASNATTSSRYWNYTLDTHTLPDGFYNVTVWVNDTNGNLNKTLSINITVDNTHPTGTMTCTPSSDVAVGQTVTCSCVSSDDFTGISDAGNIFTANPSTTTAGIITQTCTFYDLAGNIGTATDSYTVWGPSTSSSTTGGTSIVQPSSTSTESATIITPTTPATISGFASDSGVKEIQVEVSSTTNNAQVTVNKYDSTPSAVSAVSGAYKYLKVDTQNLASTLNKATMKIQVEKTWVSQKGITKNDVALLKYDETGKKWNELTTTFSSEDATYYYYTTELNSFSYFAIAPKAVLTNNPETTTNNETGETAQSSNSTWIIVGAIVLIVLIGGGIVLKSKKKRR
ncbi:Uncharacterised protein [uncultured archaeon]|nr:Uncharacterised protein [uncultured archaeon]